ncbi:Rv2640c family ArsR-like transcriptional regulator [Gordonia araii]|nr:Rv2640c family ArsR-like transcriptional regulator [Gordonia araii]NNG96448.1 winged helix-turn-helix transcriptional regulator [Gordonia araii NBRC 100433]
MPKALPIIDMREPVCCSPVAAEALDDAAALEVAMRLKALADPMRVRLLSLILNCDEECTTGALARTVGLAESTVSHHLGQLRNAGLISSARNGMTVRHIVRRDALSALCGVLDPGCC